MKQRMVQIDESILSSKKYCYKIGNSNCCKWVTDDPECALFNVGLEINEKGTLRCEECLEAESLYEETHIPLFDRENFDDVEIEPPETLQNECNCGCSCKQKDK